MLAQYAGLRGTSRQLLYDGRQPRQLDRQPGAQPRSVTCRSKISSAKRNQILPLVKARGRTRRILATGGVVGALESPVHDRAIVKKIAGRTN